MEILESYDFSKGHRIIIRKVAGKLHLEVKLYSDKLLLCVPYPYYNYIVEGEIFKITKG